MRQKTKVRTYWEVETRDEKGVPIDHSAPCKDLAEAKCVVDDTSVEGGETQHIMHVTRYRLAPLVELPAWAIDLPDRQRDGIGWETHSPNFAVRTAYYAKPNEDGPAAWGAWTFFGGHNVRTEHHTADEARAACESRLRELGFKVVKVEKGGAK